MKLSHYASKRAGQTKPGDPGKLRPLLDPLRLQLGLCQCRPTGHYEGERWLCPSCEAVLRLLNPKPPEGPARVFVKHAESPHPLRPVRRTLTTRDRFGREIVFVVGS